jgi:hypothetical protein
MSKAAMVAAALTLFMTAPSFSDTPIGKGVTGSGGTGPNAADAEAKAREAQAPRPQGLNPDGSEPNSGSAKAPGPTDLRENARGATGQGSSAGGVTGTAPGR